MASFLLFFQLREEEEVELGYHDAEFHFLHIIDHQWKYETVAKATLFPMEESVCYLHQQQLLSNAKLVSYRSRRSFSNCSSPSLTTPAKM